MNGMKNKAETAAVASTNERDAFEAWAQRYDLVSEPNYSEATKADCWAAWKARAALAAVAVSMAEAWEQSATDTEQRTGGAGQDYNQGVAEGLRICAKDLRAAQKGQA